ncbi:RNA polymerase sigma factor [Ruminiclostridium cellobioparum]|jgi:RNA polymerase sigma factor (sigma-70 family)|uniref:RNA polymerase sigma factor n=1 Tax=Ruminiclostridium cellobioparum TaxID=29355 RepID=UPI0004831482|nr:sigma-70 family RNA polymerase sigma factor [Ruminiclostridium cellobioparum]
MTIDIIQKSQGGDGDATLMLVEKFNPLLKKYAYKLSYDDAYNDLLIDFIELLHNMQIKNIHNKSEGSMVSYICTSVHSSYIKRLIEVKRLGKLLLYSDLNENELYYVESISSTNDVYNYELSFIQKILTKQELAVISMIYFTGYTVTEIANFYGTSRQAVNQMKNRALKKLRNAFSDKL